MNKPVNIKEFKELIERYETISLEEIKQSFPKKTYRNLISLAWDIGELKIQLTGFGSILTCTLCTKARKENSNETINSCENCVYIIEKQPSNILNAQCIGGGRNNDLYTSYRRIEDANTPTKLKNAYRNRAKVMREFARKNNIEI